MPYQNASIYLANLKNYFKLAETHKGIFSRFVRDFQDMQMGIYLRKNEIPANQDKRINLAIFYV